MQISSQCEAQEQDSVFLNIALLQMRSEWDTVWTFNKADEFCRIAKEKGADIALFPEMIQHSYYGVDFEKPDALKAFKEMAVTQNSSFVNHFKNLAKELNMAIVITYLEERKGEKLPRNSASLIDRNGNIVFTYTKVHTCDFGKMENSTTPGDDFYVRELDT
ncbi:MAG TPA: carbon-nitrogen hydrolase family protein, partial [Christiangramia sp.]|nr:carbon-nitrogen hydrolase family protein [Christiangramia sp.]